MMVVLMVTVMMMMMMVVMMVMMMVMGGLMVMMVMTVMMRCSAIIPTCDQQDLPACVPGQRTRRGLFSRDSPTPVDVSSKRTLTQPDVNPGPALLAAVTVAV